MEKIGDAYVRVLMEGDKRAMGRLRRMLRKEGRAAGLEFQKQQDQARLDAAQASAKKIAARLRAVELPQLKQVGAESGNAYGGEFADKAYKRILKDLKAGRLDNVMPQLGDDGEFVKGRAAWAGFWERIYDLRDKYTEDAAEKSIAAMLREQDQLLKIEDDTQRQRVSIISATNKSIILGAQSRIKEEAALTKIGERDLKDSYTRLQRAYEQAMAGGSGSTKEFRRQLEATNSHLKEVMEGVEKFTNYGGRERVQIIETIREMDEGLTRVDPVMRRFNGRLDDFAPRLGRAFGRGSRSDIVNLFGSMVEGGFKVISIVPKVVEGVSGMVRTFSSLKGTVDLLPRLAQSVGVTGGTFAKLGSSMAALGVAIPIVVVLVGTLVAAFSLLLGVVAALASTIFFSAIAAFAALAGAALPVVAGIGVLVAAISSLSDAQKKALKEAIQPFAEGMKDIGKAAADTIFGGDRFKETISNITSALTSSNMKGLVVGIADAIGNIGLNWSKALNSAGFQEWLAVMRDALPGLLEKVGQIGQNTFAGIGGLLRALVTDFEGMESITGRFLGWLEKITGEFAKWANDPGNRKEIAEFLQRAGDSAKALGGFLGEVTGLLTDIFTAGQGTGDSIFDDMTNAVRNFREYIADGGLEQWFKDTKDFASDLGGALKTVGQILDDLDNAATRFTSSGLFKLLTWLYDLGQLIGEVTPGLGDFITLIDGLAHLDFGKIKDGLLGMVPNFSDFGIDIDWGAMFDNLSQGLQDVNWGQLGLDILNGLTFGLVDGIANLDWGSIWDGIVNAFKGFFGINSPSTLFFGFGGDIIMGLLNGLLGSIGSVIEFFGGLPGMILGALGDVASWLTAPFRAGWDAIQAGAGELWGNLQAGAGEAWGWVSTKAGEAWSNVQNGATTARNWVSDRFSDVKTSAGNALDGVTSKAASTWSSVQSGASSMWGKLTGDAEVTGRGIKASLEKAGSGLDGAAKSTNFFRDALNQSKGAADGLAAALQKIKVPSGLGSLGGAAGARSASGSMLFNGVVATANKMAAGGKLNYRQLYRGIEGGESGMELVVPMQRPLSQIDPSVRDVAAYAQGRGKDGKSEKNVDMSGWHITSIQADPEAVAEEVANIIFGGLL